MAIQYKFLETGHGGDILFVSILFTLILVFILSLRLIYHKRYILNIYKPNVYMFEYEAKQKNYFSFYGLMGGLINFLILFFLLYAILLHVTQGEIDKLLVFKSLLLILILLVYKIASDFIFAIAIKKPALFPALRFLRISFENHLYFYLFIFAFLMQLYPLQNEVLFIINLILLFLYLGYSFINFHTILGKHLRLKSSKIILYLCISEILPVLIIVYGLSFQII